VEIEEMYTSYKPVLFSLAYRMLGSVMDAEDIVHEVFTSFDESRMDNIDNKKAYLCKMVTNRCIDYLKSARKKREVYVGPWLPEPLLTDGSISSDPLQTYLIKDGISTAYLLLLQNLSSNERCVFIFREAFGYSYQEISEITEKSSANCRQMYGRAKQKMSGWHEPTSQLQDQNTKLVEQFVHALSTGNIEKLLHVLADDVVFYSDGGGKVQAAIHPIHGHDRVSRFLFGVVGKASADEFVIDLAVVNSECGIVSYVNGHPYNVISFHIQNNKIASIYSVMNPDKLKHIKK
jgi:RNA polymerase sigma-70 factor (TIGR02957 family)